MQKRGIIILLLFLVVKNIQGQEILTTKKVDSLTYVMYQNKNWDSLIELGDRAEKKGIEFYYLSIRRAEAYFYTNSLLNSEKQFLKAKKQNLKETYSDEFLYRINKVYGLLGQTIDYKTEKDQRIKISEVNLTAGGNFSANKNLVNSYFGGFGATLKLNQSTYASATISGIQQISSWGKYDQDEIHVSLNKYLKNGWALHGALHLGFLISSFDHSSSRLGRDEFGDDFFRQTIDTITRINTDGGEATPIYLAYFDVAKRSGRFINTLAMSFQFQNKDYNLNTLYKLETVGKTYISNMLVDSTVIFSDTSYTESKNQSQYVGLQLGLETSYFFPLLQDNFQLNTGLYGAFTNAGFEYFIRVGMNTYIGTKVKLFYEFLYLNNVTIYSELKASLLMNTYEQISASNRMGISYSLNKNWAATLSYATSKRKDFIDNEPYSFQTIFIGLKYIIK